MHPGDPEAAQPFFERIWAQSLNDHWRVFLDDRARKDLRRIDPPTRRRILRAVTRLAQSAELTGDVKRALARG
jgi:hypothetical protein